MCLSDAELAIYLHAILPWRRNEENHWKLSLLQNRKQFILISLFSWELKKQLWHALTVNGVRIMSQFGTHFHTVVLRWAKRDSHYRRRDESDGLIWVTLVIIYKQYNEITGNVIVCFGILNFVLSHGGVEADHTRHNWAFWIQLGYMCSSGKQIQRGRERKLEKKWNKQRKQSKTQHCIVVYGASCQQRVWFHNRELKLLSIIGIIITATAFKYDKKVWYFWKWRWWRICCQSET